VLLHYFVSSKELKVLKTLLVFNSVLDLKPLLLAVDLEDVILVLLKFINVLVLLIILFFELVHLVPDFQPLLLLPPSCSLYLLVVLCRFLLTGLCLHPHLLCYGLHSLALVLNTFLEHLNELLLLFLLNFLLSIGEPTMETLYQVCLILLFLSCIFNSLLHLDKALLFQLLALLDIPHIYILLHLLDLFFLSSFLLIHFLSPLHLSFISFQEFLLMLLHVLFHFLVQLFGIPLLHVLIGLNL
jgi:hypothetical protein